MPRPPRNVLPGVPAHVIQRGNNRATTFFGPRDFEHYRDALYDASRRFRCAIHAFAFMTNHVHLLVTPAEEDGVSRMMQTIGPRYVRYVNTRRDRTGTLWEGRFRSSVIQSERYLLTCSRYIELNPVRARMVDAPGEYRWSSYRHNATGDVDSLITSHFVYDGLASSPADRRAAYRALFETALDDETAERIRHATKRGEPLGDDDFVAQVEATLGRQVTRGSHGGDRRSPLSRTPTP